MGTVPTTTTDMPLPFHATLQAPLPHRHNQSRQYGCPSCLYLQAAYICMHCAGLVLVLELQTLLCMEVQSEPSYKAGLSEALWR